LANDGRAGLFITRITDLEQINTRWGRDVGDEVLRVVARTMQDAIGSAGTVGRLRRHEFGGLLPGLDYARTAEFAAATQGSLTNPLPVLGRTDVFASIVVGAAAAQGGRPNSVIPLFHATYKMLEAATCDRPRDPRTRTFGL
jgi:diguanylate cyclase (GGDEF)-like protein